MSCECNQVEVKAKSTRNYYRYYDSPDGCDVDKKIFASARLGATAGVLLGTTDVLLYSHAVGFGPIIKRFMFHTGPLMALGATFAAVSNGLLLYRKQDDHWNYFAGGFACGPIFAAYVGSYHAVLLGGLFLGIVAALQKEAKMKCMELFPEPIGHRRTINDWRHNYNFLLKDPLEDMLKTCEYHKKK